MKEYEIQTTTHGLVKFGLNEVQQMATNKLNGIVMGSIFLLNNEWHCIHSQDTLKGIELFNDYKELKAKEEFEMEVY